MKYVVFALVMLALAWVLTGCAAPKAVVYGASGKGYIAPDLCAAVLACRSAKETTCYFNDTVYIDPASGKPLPTDRCVAAK